MVVRDVNRIRAIGQYLIAERVLAAKDLPSEMRDQILKYLYLPERTHPNDPINPDGEPNVPIVPPWPQPKR